jgi:hypothetical protein
MTGLGRYSATRLVRHNVGNGIAVLHQYSGRPCKEMLDLDRHRPGLTHRTEMIISGQLVKVCIAGCARRDSGHDRRG